MNLRARDNHGHYCDFGLSDIPVLVDETSFVLMAKPGSPMLLLESLVSGSDVPNVFEGTVIADEQGREYVMSYKRGFACMDKDKNVKKLSDFTSYTIRRRKVDMSRIPKTTICRQRLLYLYNGIQFQFKDFVGIINNMPVIKESYTPIDLSQVRQYSGLSYANKRVHFGDQINDGVVEMYKGRVCLNTNGTRIDLADNKEIR